MLGAFVNGVFGKRLGKDAVRLMALAAIGGAFVCWIFAFFMLVSAGHAPEGHEHEAVNQFKFVAWHWLDLSPGGIGSVALDIAFIVDHRAGDDAHHHPQSDF